MPLFQSEANRTRFSESIWSSSIFVVVHLQAIDRWYGAYYHQQPETRKLRASLLLELVQLGAVHVWRAEQGM